jgi:FlaA1/EpsC-like NDP-sugar epimerase
MLDVLHLIGRDQPLFDADLARHEALLAELVSAGRFLVIGGAGSIGQAVVREIFKRQPKVLHVVDISENNLVELVRDIRSTLGYIDGDFRTFAIDCGSVEFAALLRWAGGYDYVLNLSALKHVRSEKDPFTLMRLVEVNVLNTIATLEAVAHPPLPRPLPHAGGGEVSPPLPSPLPPGGRGQEGARKYFCVSTDKAANPANMMGASKRIMEMFLMRASLELPISTARFANVAFSDGSLLHGFNQRFAKRQPFSAPHDVRRYFVTPQESGELCLLSCLLGENRDIFFPKLSDKLHQITFAEIARRYLRAQGYEPHECASEDEARARVAELVARRQWPCYFFASDTTGEKDFEEFYTEREALDLDRFTSIGVIKNEPVFDPAKLTLFLSRINELKARGLWTREELVALFHAMIPEFGHKEMGKFLDEKM